MEDVAVGRFVRRSGGSLVESVGAVTSCTDFCSAKDDDKYNSNSV